MKPSDLLLEAKNILETRGWCQGFFKNMSGQCCLIGSVGEAHLKSGWRPHDDAIFTRAKDYIQSLVNVYVIEWNDYPGRTKEEVLDLLDRAIAAAKKDEQ